jgi:hypothetical protein
MESNKNSILLLSVVFILFSYLITSCNQAEEQGPQGVPGNAYLKTYVYTIDTTQWIQDPKSMFNKYVDIPASYITQNIYDSGAVLVYMYNGSNGWMGLPYTEPYTSIACDFIYGVGNISLWIISSFPNNITEVYKFKIVVIQGSSKKKAFIPPDVNTHDYYMIKNYFKLTE